MPEQDDKEQDKLTEQQIAIAMAAINKQYKRGTIFLLGSDEAEEWPSISTGALTLDKAIGIGGLPLGRIVEIFGPESCLAGDTELNVYKKKKNGTYSKIKNVTIEKLYKMWNDKTTDNNYYVESVDEYGVLVYNKILMVHETGEQECFDIGTEYGQHIQATKNHKLKSNGKWVRVESLSPWDRICVPSQKTSFKNYPHVGYSTVMPHTYPNGCIKDEYYEEFDAKNDVSVVLETRLAYEAAHMNNMSVFDLLFEDRCRRFHGSQIFGPNRLCYSYG